MLIEVLVPATALLLTAVTNKCRVPLISSIGLLGVRGRHSECTCILPCRRLHLRPLLQSRHAEPALSCGCSCSCQLVCLDQDKACAQQTVHVLAALSVLVRADYLPLVQLGFLDDCNTLLHALC